MKKHQKVIYRALCFLALFIVACNSDGGYLTSGEIRRVNDSVTLLATHIANNVSKKGAKAWLNYFDDSPDFFMASEGGIAFKNYKSAAAFINDTLVKNLKQVVLTWHNLRIDVLSTDMASIGADFHENIVWADGKTNKVDGYFTAIALFNVTRWKLRNLHWSIKAPVGRRN